MRAMEDLGFTVAYTPIEDGWYMAHVLELPGAISQGETLEEARENVRDAIGLLLEVRRDGAETGFDGHDDTVLEPLVLGEAG